MFWSNSCQALEGNSHICQRLLISGRLRFVSHACVKTMPCLLLSRHGAVVTISYSHSRRSCLVPNAQQLLTNIQSPGRNQGATFKPPGRNISAYKRSPDMIFDTIEVNSYIQKHISYRQRQSPNACHHPFTRVTSLLVVTLGSLKACANTTLPLI